jgi:hypothetical protein
MDKGLLDTDDDTFPIESEVLAAERENMHDSSVMDY